MSLGSVGSLGLWVSGVFGSLGLWVSGVSGSLGSLGLWVVSGSLGVWDSGVYSMKVCLVTSIFQILFALKA